MHENNVQMTLHILNDAEFAYSNGAALSDNPYGVGSYAYKTWRISWLFCKEIEEAKRKGEWLCE
jgi:hypothetical protein